MKKHCSGCGKSFEDVDLKHRPGKQKFNCEPAVYCSGCYAAKSRTRSLRVAKSNYRSSRPGRPALFGWGAQ